VSRPYLNSQASRLTYSSDSTAPSGHCTPGPRAGSARACSAEKDLARASFRGESGVTVGVRRFLVCGLRTDAHTSAVGLHLAGSAWPPTEAADGARTWARVSLRLYARGSGARLGLCVRGSATARGCRSGEMGWP
jgi:hypothetical protein